MLLAADRSALVVVDLQARLVPALAEGASLLARAALLLRAARRLGVPVLATEQNPAGLGHTVPQIAELLPAGAAVAKTRFAATAEPDFAARLAAFRRDQIVVCGAEAHVCVLQTALGLVATGAAVFVALDASGARDPRNVGLAADRLRANGVEVVSTEMVVFEWLGQSDTDAFRDLLPLIR